MLLTMVVHSAHIVFYNSHKQELRPVFSDAADICRSPGSG
jgi:hypothetical protein